MIFAPSGGGGGVNVWVTSTVYAAGDIVYYGKILYLCVTAHTSAAAFETDLSATKWRPLSQQVINYISDVDGASIGKWVTYADPAGTAPVDGTGGAANSTFAVSTSSALRGTTNFLFTKNSGASRQGEGFSYDFSIDPSDQGKVLQISFEYLITSAAGTYVDNDLSVWVYDVTNAALIQPAPTYIKNSTLIEKYACEFQTSSSSTSYRLIVHIGGTTNSTATIRFSNFNLGPQAKLYGSPITDSVSVSGVTCNLTNTTVTARMKKLGDEAEFEVLLSATGAASGATIDITLPYTIDTSKFTGSSANTRIVGYGQADDFGVALYGPYSVSVFSSTVVRVRYTNGTSTSSDASATAPFSLASGDSVNVKFKVPILGWSSSVVMSSDADTRVVSMIGYKSGSQALTAVATKVTFDTKTEDTHGAFDFTTNYRYTVQVPGTYTFRVATSFSTSSTGGISDFVLRKNGSPVPGQTQYIPMSATLLSGGAVTFKATAVAGDYFEIWTTPQFSVTLNAATLQIERISGPAQIAASETVSASYYDNNTAQALSAGTTTLTVATKEWDTHGAMSSGSFTCPVSGIYEVHSGIITTKTSFVAGNFLSTNVYVDGVHKKTAGVERAETTKTILECSGTAVVRCLATQVITVRVYSDVTATLYSSVSPAGVNNFVTITRVGNY